jgi:hypothetical protein
MHTPQLIPHSHAQITNRVSHRVKTSPPIALRSLLVTQVTDTTGPQNAQIIEQKSLRLRPPELAACYSHHTGLLRSARSVHPLYISLSKLELRVSHALSIVLVLKTLHHTTITPDSPCEPPSPARKSSSPCSSSCSSAFSGAGGSVAVGADRST